MFPLFLSLMLARSISSSLVTIVKMETIGNLKKKLKIIVLKVFRGGLAGRGLEKQVTSGDRSCRNLTEI